ncbi:MAG: hypothetical protein QNK37_00365 [Acidobacteriota bacterium]|nr:hypothetical protein [Acidobacteriota bacterium]
MTSTRVAKKPTTYQFPDRPIHIGPNTQISFSEAFPKLAALAPKTALGKVALKLAAETSVSVLSIAAVSSYVYSLTGAVLPTVTFQGSTPGPGITNQQLQQAYDEFQQLFAKFQGQADLWINTNPATEEPSIFSQLVSVPNLLISLNTAVQEDFVELENLDPTSSSYQSIMENLVTLIGAQQTSIDSLNTSMSTLGSQLSEGAQGLHSAATTGVLAELIAAYADEIDSLNQTISDLKNQLASDQKERLGDAAAVLGSLSLGLVGIANLWNPLGWLMLAGGAVGSYYAMSDLITLQGQISSDQSKLNNDEAWQQDDQAAAASISAFTNQVMGFASVNTAAQQELTQLEALLGSLSTDLGDAVTDLDANDLQDALNEWNEVVQQAGILSEMNAYIWPSSLLLTYPTTFSPTGNQVYAVGQAGKIYAYTQGDSNWTTLPDTAFSVVAVGSIVVGIDGAPIDGAAVSGNPVLPTYFAKTFDVADNSWTTISDFPVAAVTTDGTNIYAINQEVSNRQVYQYNGNNSWQQLAALPGSDAAAQMAVAGGSLFVSSNNSQTVYRYESGGWVQTSQTKVARIMGNGNYLGVVDVNQNVYAVDASTGSSPVKLGSSIANVAPLTTGQLYVVSTDLTLESTNPNGSPTALQSNATSCFTGDTDQVYYTDTQGNAWLLSGNNAWTRLPPFPQADATKKK